MRLDREIAQYMKQVIQSEIPGSTVYLFGSRVDDQAWGGDIDLIVITSYSIHYTKLYDAQDISRAECCADGVGCHILS